MKTMIVSTKEFFEDNKTMCMSPLRATYECHKCPVFLNLLHRLIKDNFNVDADTILDTTMASSECHPRIKNRSKLLGYIRLKAKQAKLNIKIKKIKDELFK